MCSVIEIKNKDEYYIRYHSPDSMENLDPAKNGDNSWKQNDEGEGGKHEGGKDKEQLFGGSEDDSNTTSGDSGHQRDSPKSHTNFSSDGGGKAMGENSDKEVDITSDRGSLEGSNFDEKEEKECHDAANFTNSVKNSENTYLGNANKYHPSKSKGGGNVEKVPITINSHIPASPERLVNKAKLPTNDTGTQMETLIQSTSLNKTGYSKPDSERKNSDELEHITKKYNKSRSDKDQVNKGQHQSTLNDGASGKKTEVSTKSSLYQQLNESELNVLMSSYKVQRQGNEKIKKESHLISSTTTAPARSQNKSNSFLGLPIQLQEGQKPATTQSKPSSIPILIKKEGSPKRKLSSLLQRSKSYIDERNETQQKTDNDREKSKYNDDYSDTKEKTSKEKNSGRKKSIKGEANEKKKGELGRKIDSKTNSKILPFISYQYKNGFGKKMENKAEVDTQSNIEMKSSKKQHEAKKKSGGIKDKKALVKKSYSMDSIDDLQRTLPGGGGGGVDGASVYCGPYEKNNNLHQSTNRIDIENSFFEKHPHAVLKAQKTKDGYTVYGSGKKWTLKNGKGFCF